MLTACKMIIKSEAERWVKGEVYAPLHVDTDGETMTAVEVRKLAHRFLAKGLTSNIDVQHSFVPSGCVVGESYVVDHPGDPDGFLEGAWVLGAYILPDELWEQVLKGELNGWSWAGKPENKVPTTALVKLARKMVGTTEESTDQGLLPPHAHEIDVLFTAKGQIIPTNTSEMLGHVHEVIKGTATESAFEHSHRIILAENRS